MLVFCGILLCVALAILKLHVGLSSNSITILLDATNSFLDIVTYVITFVAIFVSALPKRGYGKAEYLSSFIVSVVAVVFGGVFFFRSLNRLAMPEPIWFGWQSCLMLGVTIPVKLFFGIVCKKYGKRHNSSALTAISLDCFLDIFITATSLISFAVSGTIDYAVDAIVGIVLSILVVAIGLKMVIDNVKLIVKGRDFSDEKIRILMICRGKNVDVVGISFHDYGVLDGECIVTVEFEGSVEEFCNLSEELKADILLRTRLTAVIVPAKKNSQY